MTPDDALPLRQIDDEIRSGLKNERERLDDALFNREFYKGDFSRFPPRTPGTSYDDQRYPRHSLVMQRVVKTLTANLYKTGPGRTLADHPEASEWLQAVYRSNHVDALMQAADRWACVGDVCAIQAVGTTDPDRPVKLHLWDRSQFVAWVDPDDQRVPIAVATLDVYDSQRRLRLWTAESVWTYVCKQFNANDPNGTNLYKLESQADNPYQVLPFAFIHFEYPDSDFWTEGPGTNLRSVNDCVNFALTEGFDCLRYNARPVIVLKNVRAGWRPPSPIKPGDVWDLPAAGDGSEEDPKQEAEYLQADVSFVAAGWDDIQAYLDHTLEMHGVPPGTIRMDASAVASGIARVAEHIPLILWAEGRQRPFACYEDDLARLVLSVGAAHLARNAGRMPGLSATAQQLADAAAHLDLVLRWPNMFPDLPGEDRDRSDQWLLDNHMASRTTVLMRREKLNREEAEARLEEIAEDLEREQKLFESLQPAPLQPGEQQQQQQQLENDDPEYQDAEETA